MGSSPLTNRHHADQVPLDFRGVLSHTAAPKGSKSVHVRIPKKKMEHRVASLMLCFTADGRERGYQRPGICFALRPSRLQSGEVDPRWPAGRETRKQFEDLKSKYPDILFYAQPNGYFDNATCLAWLQDTISSFAPSHDHLLCMDNLGGHTNPVFRRTAWLNKPTVWLVYTPKDCTDACAVTDDGLGQTIKRKMRNMFLDHFLANTNRWQGLLSEHIPEAECRSLYAKWLHTTITDFYKYTVVKGRGERGLRWC